MNQTYQGPVVQSIVNLTGLLVVKMLTALVSTISNSQVFLLKNVSSFCKCKSYSHFFNKNISLYAIDNGQSFNNTLSRLSSGPYYSCFSLLYFCAPTFPYFFSENALLSLLFSPKMF